MLKEVEKEVVLLDPTACTTAAREDQMQVAFSSNADLPSTLTSRVIKLIKKLEVQVLCVQHNPVCVSTLDPMSGQSLLIVVIGGCRSQKGKQTRQDQERFACAPWHGAYQGPGQRWGVRSVACTRDRGNMLGGGAVGSWCQKGVQVG